MQLLAFSVQRRVINLKKATVVAEMSLILGEYCGCFVVLIVTVMFIFNRWVYSRSLVMLFC